MINAIIYILKRYFSPFPIVPLMECLFHNLYAC